MQSCIPTEWVIQFRRCPCSNAWMDLAVYDGLLTMPVETVTGSPAQGLPVVSLGAREGSISRDLHLIVKLHVKYLPLSHHGTNTWLATFGVMTSAVWYHTLWSRACSCPHSPKWMAEDSVISSDIWLGSPNCWEGGWKEKKVERRLKIRSLCAFLVYLVQIHWVSNLVLMKLQTRIVGAVSI